MPRGFVTALRTLTILPVPGRDADDLARSLPWFPLTGALIGAILAVVAYSLDALTAWPAGAAAAVLVAGVLLTRGLHLDGLADWADGFGGGHTQERTLAIMKDPRVGAFGVTALVLVLLAKGVAYGHLIETAGWFWIFCASVASRAIMAELSAVLPYARREGGTAGPFVAGASRRHRLAVHTTAAVLMIAAVGPAGALVHGGAWGFCRLLGVWFHKRVGGITGDLLGAANELVETVVLLACAGGGDALAGLRSWEVLIR